MLLNMSDPAAEKDLVLLTRYTRDRAEDAFAEIVRRHVDLVHSAALRQVRSPQLAEEVAQSAFADLARNAYRLAPDTILTAWLYQVTRRTAIDVVRREARRQLREHIATEMNTMNATTEDWTHIEPLLDDAMSALDETDRAAVLLRYFENKSLREVGQTLGTSDDAMQKRVSRAVERLREFFAKRGVTVGASGLVVVISANAVQAAPVGLAVTISTAATLIGTTIATTATATAVKTIAMTTLQKTFITVALTAAIGTGVYEARQAVYLRKENQTLQQQQAPLAEQLQKLQQERDAATQQAASLHEENQQLNRSYFELLKLRAEVTRLKPANLARTTAEEDPNQPAVKQLLDRVNKIKQKLEETPDAKIPELQFLTDEDWIDTARGNLDSEADLRKAFSLLRGHGERHFLESMETALQKYFKANNDQFPTDLSQLKSYFETTPGDDILIRYHIVPADSMKSVLSGGDWLITQKTFIDEENDTQYDLGRKGVGGASYRDAEALNTLAPAMKAFTAAAPTNSDGRVAFSLQQLVPYLTTPEQKAAYDKLTHHRSSDSK